MLNCFFWVWKAFYMATFIAIWFHLKGIHGTIFKAHSWILIGDVTSYASWYFLLMNDNCLLGLDEGGTNHPTSSNVDKSCAG